MEKMKVSVVVPVYNKVEYVERCFRQLLAQEMDGMEIVAVDDGSTDGSGALCDQWPGDCRLRIFHTPNQGVTAARRYGVEQAQGEYIVFVDCDDELLPGALRTLYDAACQTEADEVIATFCTQDGTQSPVVYEGEVCPTPLIRTIIAGKNRFPVLWAALFRRSVLKDCLDTPRDIIEGEDKLMQVKVLMKRPKVWFITDCVYRYTVGVPNTRRRTLERERLYDQLLRQTLQPQWTELHSAFVLHQLKEYERFIHDGCYTVRNDYYREAVGPLPASIPLYDRLVWALPPVLSRPFILLYRRIINLKQHRL